MNDGQVIEHYVKQVQHWHRERHVPEGVVYRHAVMSALLGENHMTPRHPNYYDAIKSINAACTKLISQPFAGFRPLRRNT